MGVVVLLILIAAVVGIPLVLLARRRPSAGGASSPSEFLVYLILVGAVLTATNAFSSLVELLIPGEGVVVQRPDQLALSLATLLVAGVVSVAVWLTLERRAHEGERPARALYISAVTGFSMAVVAVALVRLGLGVVGQEEFANSAAADFLAFGGLWLGHEYLRKRDVEFDIFRSLVGSTVGLVLSVGGFGSIVQTSLSAALDQDRVIVGADQVWDGAVTGLVMLIVGVAYLSWFWFRQVARAETGLRNGYATGVSLLSWFAMVSALGVVLYTVMSVVLGIDEPSVFGDRLPGTLTTTLTGALVYWHHRGVLGQSRSPFVRFLAYTFSAAGFMVGAGALVIIAATLIEQLVETPLAGTGSRAILGSVVALAISGLVLWRYWVPSQRLAEDPSEQRSVPRKAAIVGLLTVSALTGLGALIAVLFVLLRSALGGSGEVAEVLSWSVPLALVAGILTWYFTSIRPRRDNITGAITAEAVGPQSLIGPVKVSIVTLVASDPGPLPNLVEGMRFLRRSDGVGVVTEEQAGAIVGAIASLNSRAALVTVEADSFEVIPLT
ncbi:MAG TPA: DUF5671 domain-containing protein [Acidimicrobiia bacterium]|nr:DUF5671 domain-containing protein [Acidimicrobiia bacterium]